MASADFGYCVFILQTKKTYLSGLPQNQVFQGLAFVNPAADWRIVVHCAACISTPNRMCLTLYDVINFNDITSALSLTFTGV